MTAQSLQPFGEQIVAFSMSMRALQRLLLGSAQDVEFDGSGRILVAPELRVAVGITRDVVMMGLGTHFELWDAAALARREAEDLAQSVPDVLNEFSF